jgi:heat-inducible transcriptional repressor
MSGAPALVLRRLGERRTLVKIQFVRTRPLELLAVLVGSDGTVDNRFLPLERSIEDGELERLHNLLDEIVVGRTLLDVRDELARRMAEREGEITRLRQLGHALLDAASAGLERRHEVVIEGHSRLLDQPEFVGVDTVRELLRTFDDRERLLTLLDQAIEADRVQVFLGDETGSGASSAISLVAASYRDEAGEPGGAVGIIGPQRMDYPFVVPLVGATADAMSAALARKRDGGSIPSRS